MVSFPAQRPVFLSAGKGGYDAEPGGHTDGPNWPYFLDFAARHLKHD
jgi:hypothetical protein